MATKNFKNIKIEKDKGANKGITWLILNRPEKRNAMSPELHFEMSEALDILAEDDDTKIVVLTGAGKAFSAGQDLALYFRANQNDAKNRQKSDPDSEHFLEDFLERFWHPWGFAWRVCKNLMFHIF